VDRSFSQASVWTLPNGLTLLRILLIPFILLFLSFEGKLFSFIAALCFSLAALTDLLDGFYARKWKQKSVLGTLMDPVADKLLIILSLIGLVNLERVPFWIVEIIVGREIAVTGLRSVAAAKNIILPASRIAKYKTTYQIVAIIGLMIHYQYFCINFHKVGIFFLWIALFLTIYSGYNYFRKIFKQVLC